MQQLRDEISHCLNNPDTPLWWPGLAERLVARFNKELPRYSTSQSQHLLAFPSEKTWRVTTSSQQIALSVKTLPLTTTRMLESRGLTFAAEAEIRAYSLTALQRALVIIEKTPSLASRLAILVKSIHVLHVFDPEYDVSFSDPNLPFSVFLNSSKGRDADLRTAEALIHETMHLQLSLIERFLPIAVTESLIHFSPWKLSKRPISGLMHALYVFQVIRQWLNSIKNSADEVRKYAAKREGEICNQIHQLQPESYVRHLTPYGRLLLSKLLSAPGEYPLVLPFRGDGLI